MNWDEQMMTLALEQAREAARQEEVPIGAVLVREGQILAAAFNRCIAAADPTAHAEILALRGGAEVMGNYRLPGTTLYVTLEPCLMCVGALIHARIARLVYGAVDPKGGAVVSLYRLLDDTRLNHRVSVTGGVLAAACGEILSGFFRKKRIIASAHR
ncbi:MAG: tRNA adenosine(34) deaminase TadA [Syntrophales bacterium]|nr:tRNA adenosine(34) deaminase TadA [Syntrophales bacterium]